MWTPFDHGQAKATFIACEQHTRRLHLLSAILLHLISYRLLKIHRKLQ